MCDTMLLRRNGDTYFAKNSDREPDEPQHIIYLPAVQGDASATVNTTYLSIAQVPDRHALILSQPSWLWGGEIGVNEHGLVLGNEAVFTKLVARQGQALLGMDLLRLALERCVTARQAIACIGQLLSEHGQGGPAGYRDKNFRYDNSFIVADPTEGWILETAGRHWVAKRIERFDAISNALCIGGDYELQSAGLADYASAHGLATTSAPLHFANTFGTRFMKFMGKAERRRACNLRSLEQLHEISLPALAHALRQHASDSEDLARHSNRDVCMHAAGLLRPSQTTGSMVVQLSPGASPQIFITGTSAPCLGLFQPVSFADFADNTAVLPADLWQGFEPVHHLALRDIGFRRALQQDRDEQERAQFDNSLSVADRRSLAMQWHQRWQQQALSHSATFRPRTRYQRYWHRRRQVVLAK